VGINRCCQAIKGLVAAKRNIVGWLSQLCCSLKVVAGVGEVALVVGKVVGVVSG
jgi:hypothetical protein